MAGDAVAGKALRIPSADVIQRLCAYRWPGNVRELQNVLKRIMILGDGEEGLNGLLAVSPPPAAAPTPAGSGQALAPGGVLDPNELNDLSALSLKKVRKRAMDKVEKEVITYVLAKTGWNRSKATKILKISYKTLLYKIKDLGIEPPPDVMG
jgi:DNA-binding NtrC family response regulator